MIRSHSGSQPLVHSARFGVAYKSTSRSMSALADVALPTIKVAENLISDGFVETSSSELPCKLYYQVHGNSKYGP